jgi:hypothetical protein
LYLFISKAAQWLKTLDQKIAYKTEPWKFENEVEKHGGISLQKYVLQKKKKFFNG